MAFIDAAGKKFCGFGSALAHMTRTAARCPDVVMPVFQNKARISHSLRVASVLTLAGLGFIFLRPNPPNDPPVERESPTTESSEEWTVVVDGDELRTATFEVSYGEAKTNSAMPKRNCGGR